MKRVRKKKRRNMTGPRQKSGGKNVPENRYFSMPKNTDNVKYKNRFMIEVIQLKLRNGKF